MMSLSVFYTRSWKPIILEVILECGAGPITILQQKQPVFYYFWSGIQKNTETETAIIPGWREFGINYSNRKSNNSLCVRLRRGSKMIWFTDI